MNIRPLHFEPRSYMLVPTNAQAMVYVWVGSEMRGTDALDVYVLDPLNAYNFRHGLRFEGFKVPKGVYAPVPVRLKPGGGPWSIALVYNGDRPIDVQFGHDDL